MSADEVRGESSAAPQPARSGPRHAAPKRPLFTRFQVPAGRAIAVAAMPTAILMGMGLTPKLALADDRPTPQSLTAEEYEDCVELLKQGDEASPSPSASASESESGEPSPSASATDSPQSPETSDPSEDEAADDNGSSSDSGSDDEPTPSPSASTDKDTEPQDANPAPGESPAGADGVLDAIGDTVTGVVDGITGIGKGEEGEAAPTPTPSASSGAEDGTSEEDDTSGDSGDSGKDSPDSGKDTDPAGNGAEEPTDAASDAAQEAEEAADEATASPTPSPSASATVDPDDCPIATDVEGGIDNEILLPDDPWFLDASSLKLKGADYQGVVKVKTASGNVKEVLKYVISDGTDIGDLHQTVKDKQSGKTHHVQADKGSMSTITDGDTVMYTEKISGKLFGLVQLTFSPESPPPLNIPLIYFTDVKVQQAGQFGGTLRVPGLSSYITD